MSGKYGANQYKQTAVTTATREQVLLMLYEAAIRNIKRAADLTDTKDRAKRGESIGKAHDIIIELITSLDHQVGGAVSQELERLYNYVIEQLIKGNIENKREPLISAVKVLETLLDGWKGAVAQIQGKK